MLLFPSPSRSPPPPTPLPFCVNPPESGAATRLAPPLPLTPRELTGDVIRDPRWERKRQTPRGRQRRFLSFVKTRDLISPSKGESQSSPNHLHFALLLAKPRRPCSVLLRVGAGRWHFSPFNHLEENLGAEKYVFLPWNTASWRRREDTDLLISWGWPLGMRRYLVALHAFTDQSGEMLLAQRFTEFQGPAYIHPWHHSPPWST